MRFSRLPRLHIERMTFVTGDNVETLLVDDHATAIEEHAQSPRVGDLDLPENRAIVGIHGVDHAVTRHEQPAVFEQRWPVAMVAVDHLGRSGLAKPLQRHGPVDQLIATARAVARISIKMRPLARPIEAAPPTVAPCQAPGHIDLPLRKRPLSPRLQLTLDSHPARPTNEKHSTIGSH